MISNKDELLDLLRQLSQTLEEAEVISDDQACIYFDAVDICSEDGRLRVASGFPNAEVRHRALCNILASAIGLTDKVINQYEKSEVQS